MSLTSLLSIECGVPQGSILGPLMYILFTNDIVPTHFEEKYLSAMTVVVWCVILMMGPIVFAIKTQPSCQICSLPSNRQSQTTW